MRLWGGATVSIGLVSQGRRTWFLDWEMAGCGMSWGCDGSRRELQVTLKLTRGKMELAYSVASQSR